MIKKILELVINTEQAENALQSVDKGVQRIDKDLTKTEQEFQKVNKDADELNKNISKVPNSTTKVVTGVKKIGTAIKGIGIGLLISAIALLKELFESNQKIVDAFAIAFEALSLAFNDFFNFVSDNVGTVTKFFKSIFDDPIESIKAFGNAIIENIINRIKATIDTFGHLSKVVTKVFKGDFSGAMESAKDAGNSFVDSLTGVPNTIDKVSEVVNEAIPIITEYTKSTFESAKAAVELKNAAELATAANQGLIEKYDRQAEQQRQIRDDERKSLKERKEANDELGRILEEQQKAMLENAQISLAAAKADLKSDKDSIEGKKAVMEAENELAAVRAQIEGFRSEQLVNAASLEREELELINSKLESENRIAIERKRINAEQTEDNIERLEKLKEIDAQERDIELKRLQSVIDTANAGTQAKIDAEIAFNEAKLEFDRQALERAKEIADAQVAINKEKNDKKDADDEAQKAKDIAREQRKQDDIQSIQANTLNAISNLITAFENQNEENAKKAFNLQKALGIVETLINTSVAIMKVAKETTDFTPVQALRTGNMIAMGIAGAAQVAAIASQKFTPSGASGGSVPTPNVSGGGASPTQAPSFNVVGQSGFNQIAGALGQQPPAQAFVVAGDVTTAQQLANNTIQQATF